MPAQVGERRRFGQQIAEWDGKGWVPLQEQATKPAMSEGEITAYMESPEFQQAREQGTESGTAEAAGPIAGILAATALGGAAGGAVTRAAFSPGGLAAIEGTRTLVKTHDPVRAAEAAGRGYLEGKAFGAVGKAAGALAEVVSLPAFLKAKLAHTIARGVKVAAEAAPKAAEAAPAAAKAVQAAATLPTPTVVASRVLKLREAGLSAGQIAEQLRTELAPGARGIGVSYFRRMTDMVLEHAKNASVVKVNP